MNNILDVEELSEIKKLTQTVQVKNSMGIHTRPATVIVQILQTSKCDVHFTLKKTTINAKSILSILMLCAQKNSRITITVEGIDADRTMDRLVTAFENRFGELRTK